MKRLLTLLSLTLALGTLPQIAMAKTFPDVPTNHPHANAIEAISDAGIINGYPDGTFQPDKNVNRVEFLKILIEASGDYTPTKDPADFDIYSLHKLNFTDLEDQQWYVPYVRYAHDMGIIAGYPDRSFKPADGINLAEALKIIFETFDLPKVTFIREPDQWYEYYTGALESDFTSYTKLDVSRDIDKSLSRGEVASLIDYFLSKREKVESSQKTETPKPYKYEPLLLEGEFLVREQEHVIKGYVMYPTTCGRPKANVIIDDTIVPEQVRLEILEAEPMTNPEDCIKEDTEHEITFRFTASYQAMINEVLAYGDQVSFIIHNTKKEINHPNAPLVLYLKGPSQNGMIHTEGLIYGTNSCDKADVSVLSYPGTTAITQIEIKTVTEGQSCVAGMTELLFEVDIPENTIIRGRINEQPITITFEKESIEAFQERSRARR